MLRWDNPDQTSGLTPSMWIVLSQRAETLAALRQASGRTEWRELATPSDTVWSDQYASTLPQFRWNTLLGIKP